MKIYAKKKEISKKVTIYITERRFFKINTKEFYNLKYDRVFKSILADPNNPKVLELILSDILDRDVHIMKFMTNERPVKNKLHKVNILDVLIYTDDDALINVEINTNYSESIKLRNLSYYASIYEESIKDITNRKIKTMQININHNDKSKRPKKIFHIWEDTLREKYTDYFCIIDINVDRYKELCYDKNIKGNKEHIYLVMLGANARELENLSKVDKYVKEVSDKVFIFNADGTYTKTISRDDEMKLLGKLEGYDKGVVNVAKNLLNMAMPIKKIEKATGLSKKEILKLKKND